MMRFFVLLAFALCSFSCGKMSAANVTVYVKDDSGAPVTGAKVVSYNEATPGTIISEGYTNNYGTVVLTISIEDVPVKICAWSDSHVWSGVTFTGISNSVTISLRPKTKVTSTPKSTDAYDDFVGSVDELEYVEPIQVDEIRVHKPKSAIPVAPEVVAVAPEVVPALVDSVAFAPVDDGMGYTTFSIADTMKVGTVYTVRLRIAKLMSRALADGMTSPVERIRVAGTMEAVITPTDHDSAFDIKTVSSAVQTVEMDSSFTSWVWSIRPLKSGQHGLNMRIVIKQDDVTKDVPVFERTIYVTATPIFTIWKFIAAHWQWLIITLVIPPIGWYAKHKLSVQKSPQV